MGIVTAPLPPMPKDPKERADFVRAYLEVQRRPPVSRIPYDTSFRIHDAGWALIIGFSWLIVLTIIIVNRL